ncbi:MAG: hypothetical protein C0467_24865 [Planctomycetaceae bacterium]|nr:hypothetical protein [Planctomycetaceae bacterium]
MRLNHRSRRGISLVEFALVSSLTMLIMLGLLVGCVGIFRYQQVAALARETARYASVHGSDYAQGHTSVTDADIYQTALVPKATLLDLSRTRFIITWSPKYPVTRADSDGTIRLNTVTVTVEYDWKPEYFFSSVTLKSTSVAAMCY